MRDHKHAANSSRGMQLNSFDKLVSKFSNLNFFFIHWLKTIVFAKTNTETASVFKMSMQKVVFLYDDILFEKIGLVSCQKQFARNVFLINVSKMIFQIFRHESFVRFK